MLPEITLGTLPGIGRSPQAIAVLDGRLYVANRATDNVSLVEDDHVVGVVSVGDAPAAIAADPKSGLVYVANEEDSSISIISGDEVVRTVPAPRNPLCLTVFEGRVYAGGRGENAVAVLDGTSGRRVATIPVEASIGVFALAANPSTRLLYASTYDSVEIIDLDSLKVAGQFVHAVYRTLAVDPVGGGFYITVYQAYDNTHHLAHFTTFGEKELGRVAVGGDPQQIAVHDGTGRIYVANAWTNDISVIDARDLELIGTLPTGLRPAAVAVDEQGRVYVANSESNNVAVLEGESSALRAVVPLAMMPLGMAVDAGSGNLYVANASTNSVFVVRGARVVAKIAVGLHPFQVAVGPEGEHLFVLNHVSGDLSRVSLRKPDDSETVGIGARPQGLALSGIMDQLYASDLVVGLGSQRLLRRTELLTTYGSTVSPVEIQLDPQRERAYMVASNGVPGSNSGLIIYVVDARTGQRLDAHLGGLSTTGLALDLDGGRVFSTAGRFGYYQLIVNDIDSFKPIAELGLDRHPAALAYNPQTNHLFACLTHASQSQQASQLSVQVLDSRSLGAVASIALPGEPRLGGTYAFAIDEQRGFVYMSDAQSGTVHVLRDAAVPPPPSPTPSFTPTPWPTLPPTARPSATVVAAAEPRCKMAPGPRFAGYWQSDSSLRLGLGCPQEEAWSGFAAEQPFERGHMIWRQADQTVFVLYDDGVWRSYADNWQEGMPDLSCEATPPSGLYQPKRGFGLVWCRETGARQGLGWALDEESGSAAEWQTFESGELITSSLLGSTLALFADGTFLEYGAP
jgi:YVTN family beta-propeller protein